MLQRIRASLAQEGLHIVLPVGQAALDRAGAGVVLTDLLAGARTGLVIADGGRTFFDHFVARGDGLLTAEPWEGSAPPAKLRAEQVRRLRTRLAPDPLDDHTREVVPRALARALVAQDGAFAVRFPFASAPLLPMQRLGRAAGLPAPGPLGLQIHPRFGPWWAYRAFAVLTVALPEEPTVDSPCEGCPAPCTSVCPGQAVATGGFVLGRCIARRLADEGCHLSCAARLRCPVGAAEAYPPEQLGYHMAASLRHLRAPPG